MRTSHPVLFAQLAAWTSRVFGEVFLGLLYLTSAQIVSSSFLTAWGSMIGRHLPEFLSFSVERPFAFRILTPWLLRRLSDIAPRARIEAFLHKPVLPDAPERVVDAALRRYGFPAELDVELMLIEILFVGVLLATAYVMRATLRIFPLPRFVTELAPALFLSLLPLHFAGGGYIYDFPELLLSSLATLTFLRQRWFVYYPLVALAVLNKESSVLLASFCLVFVAQRNRQLALRHLALHAVFALPPFLATRLAFSDAPGHDVVDYAAHNLRYFFTLAPWTARARPFDPLLPLPQSLNLLLIAVGAGLLFYRFHSKPLQARAMFVGTATAVLPLYLLFGYENEIRVFALCFPSAVILAGHTLADLLEDVPRVLRSDLEARTPAPARTVSERKRKPKPVEELTSM